MFQLQKEYAYEQSGFDHYGSFGDVLPAAYADESDIPPHLWDWNRDGEWKLPPNSTDSSAQPTQIYDMENVGPNYGKLVGLSQFHDMEDVGNNYGRPVVPYSDYAGNVPDRALYATHSGRVESVDWEDPNNPNKGWGYNIVIRTVDGGTIRYGHVDPASGYGLAKDDLIMQGQYIGHYADPTNGLSTGPHVHYEQVDASGNLVNPGSVSPVGVGGTLTSRYGWRQDPNTGEWKLHKGVDYVGPRIR
ncbi:MAG TPA: peptidoglycan DD-metalloendopeptidase family protein [Burkholderiales bacterium]